MTRLEEIEARKLEIREEVETTEEVEKIEELNQEVDALNEEVKQIEEQKEEEEKAEELEEKSYMAKEVVKEERKIMNEELRNSKEYINAYAEYIKGDDKELRALLSSNVEGTVEAPQFIYDVVKTAWEREDLMALVKKVSMKGNLKVQFEVSGSDATIHTEGGSAVTEEELVLGVVTLLPVSIKKWISISDEVYDLRGEEFLRYIYDELTYRIAKKCADTLIGKIKALPTTLTANDDGIYDEVSANQITGAPALGLVANAIANLSDEATNPVIVMNKLTYSNFKEAQYAGNYAVDIFEGCKVIFNNSLPAYASANGGVYMIVGDFANGSLANLVNGEGIEMKFDDKTLMTQDLIRILGRRYVAVEPIADKSFVNVKAPTSQVG